MTTKPIIKILKSPRITEKASVAYEQNVYTFDVMTSANKTEIKKAITALYKVVPVKVHIVKVPDKTISLRGRKVKKNGGKKALVYLKKGDKIEFV